MPASNRKQRVSKPPPVRQRLLDAARVEFGLFGIEGATTRGIAERAKCNEVSLFRLFGTKLKLLCEVVRTVSQEAMQQAVCDCELCGDLAPDLIRLAEDCAQSMEGSLDLARALIGEGNRHPGLVKEMIGDVMAPLHQRISRYLQERQRAGRVRADLDTGAFAEILTAALMGGVLRRGGGLTEIPMEAWTEMTVEFLVRGILTGETPE